MAEAPEPGHVSTGFVAAQDWPAYLSDAASSRYSRLDQLRPDNVAKLEVAWIYNSGDAHEGDRSQVQCNPLIPDGVLYGTQPS